jgi:hypothetical protein
MASKLLPPQAKQETYATVSRHLSHKGCASSFILSAVFVNWILSIQELGLEDVLVERRGEKELSVLVFISNLNN